MSLSKKKLATLERKSELYRKRTRDMEIEDDVQEEINEVKRNWEKLNAKKSFQDKLR